MEEVSRLEERRRTKEYSEFIGKRVSSNIYICQRMAEDYGFFYERRKRK